MSDAAVATTACACASCAWLSNNVWLIMATLTAILLTCAAVLIHIIISCRRDRKQSELRRIKRNERKCSTSKCNLDN